MSRLSVAMGKVRTEAVKDAFDALNEELVKRTVILLVLVFIVFGGCVAAVYLNADLEKRVFARVQGFEQKIVSLEDSNRNLQAGLQEERLSRIQLETSFQAWRQSQLMPLAPKPAPTATPISGPWYFMIEVSKPDWLTYKDDRIVVSGGLTASVVWIDSRTWIEVEIKGNMKPVASIGPDDLIMIQRSTADKLENFVYLNINKDKITWYRPKGVGNSYDNLQLVAAIWLSPMADGISPWAYARGDVSPYIVGEKVFVQEGARSASFK